MAELDRSHLLPKKAKNKQATFEEKFNGLYMSNKSENFQKPLKLVYKRRDLFSDKKTKNGFNPRRAMLRGELFDKKEIKLAASSTRSSFLVRTSKRTLLRNSKFQDLLYYALKHASCLRQNRVLMKLKW